MALVALRGDVDADAAQHGETEAVAGAGLGAVVAVNGAGGAQADEAFLGAGAGAAAAVRSLPAVGLAPGRLSRGLTRGAAALAADGGSLAGAARAGAGAAARGLGLPRGLPLRSGPSRRCRGACPGIATMASGTAVAGGGAVIGVICDPGRRRLV
jgi:hypothetical protein